MTLPEKVSNLTQALLLADQLMSLASSASWMGHAMLLSGEHAS